MVRIMEKRKLVLLGLTAVCVALFIIPARAEKVPTTPKWQRFELTLKSSVTYTNPIQEAEMRVLFVSPLGETNRVYGFWDGGKTWRVRFQPRRCRAGRDPSVAHRPHATCS